MIRWRLGLVTLMLALAVPSVASAVPHYSVAASKSVIRRVAHAAGYGKANTDALLWLAKRESRYHNWSHNTRYQCHGLFQLSRGMAHGHAWWRPEWNTKRAIRYIKHRYGSPLRAKRFWQRHHWY